MDEIIEDDIEECLDCYDPENRTFPQIARRISAGGELTKVEVLQILNWKMRHLKTSNAATISANHMTMINGAIMRACKENGGSTALELLDRIPGVGLAAGTALLSVCHPEEFTALDWRVVEVLHLFPSRKVQDQEKSARTTYWTVNDYLGV
jgi:hypothetical protein